MSLGLFKGIIDRAGFSERVKILHLYNIGEPLINKELPCMISYAKEKSFSDRISTVTNGSLLTPDVSRALIKSGVDRITVSLYGLNDDDYEVMTGVRLDFEALYQNIVYLNSIKRDAKVHVKIVDNVLSSPGARERFYAMFSGNCDSYSVETILPIWPNFKYGQNKYIQGGQEIDRSIYEGVPALDRVACHYPFYSMVVNPKGGVNPCLADWSESLVLGDARDEPLVEIWNSKRYHDFRYLQLVGGRSRHGLCSTCGTLKAATAVEDDIDEDRMHLLEKLYPSWGRLD